MTESALFNMSNLIGNTHKMRQSPLLHNTTSCHRLKSSLIGFVTSSVRRQRDDGETLMMGDDR